MSDRPIWRSLPAGSYQEGRDLVLGPYCAFADHKGTTIHHMPTPDDLAARATLFPPHERNLP